MTNNFQIIKGQLRLKFVNLVLEIYLGFIFCYLKIPKVFSFPSIQSTSN